tara:strand:+ start:233 stop:460 length:228 start_codon:yes stop_codon:yes gene_type:complete
LERAFGEPFSERSVDLRLVSVEDFGEGPRCFSVECGIAQGVDLTDFARLRDYATTSLAVCEAGAKAGRAARDYIV